jgi:hypothetical protein
MWDENHGGLDPDLPVDDWGVCCNPTNSTGMQTGQTTEGGSSAPLVVGTAYRFGRPRCTVIYSLLHGGGVCLMGARRWLICVSLSLALIIVIKFLGGGNVQQALVSLSIGNGPLYPEEKLTHTHTVALFLGVLACCLKMCMSWSMVSVVIFGGGTMPAMADVKLSTAQMSASAGVSVGMVRCLCLKNTVLQVWVCLMSLM